MVALARVVHPAPAIAVTVLAGVLAILLGGESGAINGLRVALVVAAVAGSQVATGALNDWADRNRDAAAGRPKPIAQGLVTPGTVLALAGAGVALQVAASALVGATFALLGLVALGSAVSYDLWLSRTPASVVPYVVSFGTLPLWIATGVAVSPARVLGAMPLAALFAAAAHLANTLRDFESDRATGSRALAQLLGRAPTRWIALALGLAVGIGVAVALAIGGRLSPAVAVSGAIGLAAVGAGAVREAWLWRGQLVAAVAWTAAWALSGRT
jgi:4-hydroxybenzoate polyprenyltransferase